jgi:tetratricopeptide (TPR) repeat protein
MDVLSMAALLEHMARLLAAPLKAEKAHYSELYAIGRLFADLGFADEAIQVFENTLETKLDADTQFHLVENLACLHRRRGDYSAALELWESAASDGHVYAHVEIAKYYEHRSGKLDKALEYTRSAIEIITSQDAPRFERLHWQPLLEHRLNRLERKMARVAGEDQSNNI